MERLKEDDIKVRIYDFANDPRFGGEELLKVLKSSDGIDDVYFKWAPYRYWLKQQSSDPELRGYSLIEIKQDSEIATAAVHYFKPKPSISYKIGTFIASIYKRIKNKNNG